MAWTRWTRSRRFRPTLAIGQIFLVTLVAGLVSLWRPGERLKARRERREKESRPDEPTPLAD